MRLRTLLSFAALGIACVFFGELAILIHSMAQQLPRLLHNPKLNAGAILCILLALVVGFVIGRIRASHSASFQNRGEAMLSHLLQSHFSPPDYHLMNHVTLQMKDGTTQIDHILVSRFGVFVIETKDYKGWIFADANHSTWTQVLFKWKFRFQNPIFQNMRHVRAVAGLLDFLPRNAVASLVVFTGDAEFKTGTPPGVMFIYEVVDYLRGHKTEVLTRNQVQFCVGRIETMRLAITGKTDVEHVQSLSRRHDGAV